MTNFTQTAPALDQGLSQNIALAALVASTVLLIGARQFDRFVIAEAEKPKITPLEGVCHQALGADATWLYDPARGQVSLYRIKPDTAFDTALPTTAGQDKALSLIETLTAFESLAIKPSEHGTAKVALLVDATLMIETPSAPHEQYFSLVQAIERFARTADRSRVLLLRAANTGCIPAAITASTAVRAVPLPDSSRDERMAYARIRAQQLASACSLAIDDVARSLAGATDEWPLTALDALIQSATTKKVTRLIDLEELALALKVGAATSPWAGDEIRVAVANAQVTIERRVKGQPEAVAAICSALKKSVVGLAGGHQSRHSEAPKILLFAAGPTGTGKTESAKSLAELIFGSEAVLRIDCAGLAKEHAIDRLTGAPPGYVGYDRGGELTEGIRAKPNSLVLFDECEKAHSKFWDIFLSIADDGRLTSGQGDTSFFSQAGLILTSNLGMYETTSDGTGQVTRRARFDYDTPFATIQNEVREAVRDFFINTLGRPELLGRFGGHRNVIVYGFLRDLAGVAGKFVGNLQEKTLRLHGITLDVAADVIEEVASQTKASPDALVLGARGLAQKLDAVLVTPLADHLFESGARNCHLKASIKAGLVQFSQT